MNPLLFFFSFLFPSLSSVFTLLFLSSLYLLFSLRLWQPLVFLISWCYFCCILEIFWSVPFWLINIFPRLIKVYFSMFYCFYLDTPFCYLDDFIVFVSSPFHAFQCMHTVELVELQVFLSVTVVTVFPLSLIEDKRINWSSKAAWPLYVASNIY